LNKKKFLVLLVVLVGLGVVIKIAEAGTLSDSGMDLTNMYKSSVAWADIDNDGDFDLAIMGWDGTNIHCQIYKNGADNKLTLSQSLTGVSHGSLSFGDYDRDGDLDLAVTGKVIEYGTTKIYQNDGNGNFSDSGIEMIDLYDSALAWGDYDNDGDLDLAVIGFCMGVGNIAKIYRNKGDGTFEDSGITDLMPVASGFVAWGDYDNDGDLDLALTGDKGAGEYISYIYENKYRSSPAHPFSLVEPPLTGLRNSFLAWGDYNNDGWLDIAICGQTTGGRVCEIWENNAGTFTKDQSLDGVYNSSLAWGDYDNDGTLDLVVTGVTSGGEPSSEVYKNEGSSNYTFSKDSSQNLDDVDQGSVAWCDYDGDRDIDLALTGYSESGPVTKIYENDESKENNLPFPPVSSSLKAEYNSAAGELTISWDNGSDTETQPPTGLYYNFRIGSEPGKDDLVAARYGSPLLGNFISKSTTTVHTRTFELYAKGYYWSVQVIDTGLGRSWSQEGTESGWAEEGVFVDTTPPPSPSPPTDEGLYTYNTTIRFSWTQTEEERDPETAIFNYKLWVRSEDGTVFKGDVGDVRSYSVPGCEYNKTYEAQIMAQSGGGDSGWSGPSDGIMVVRLLDISNNLIHPKKGDKPANIKYFIINPTKVNLKIYNLMGELVKVLVDDQYKVPDEYPETWSGENDKGSTVASGIYLVHIEIKGANATEKICVVK